MRFPGKHALKKKKSPEPFVDHASGWYGADESTAIIRRELNRSSRNGLPLSLVMIDVPGKNGKGESTDAAPDLLDELVSFVSENTRDYDVKFLCRDRKIGILLVDTSIEGAKSFVEKMVVRLCGHYVCQGKTDYYRGLSALRISVYPAGESVNCESLIAKPVMVKDLILEKECRESDHTVSARENGNYHLDWTAFENGHLPVGRSTAILQVADGNGKRVFSYRNAKRALDIAGAIVGVLIFSPLMLLIALAIKLTSSGPVIFRQKRVGYCGRPFTFLKFRTMHINGDDEFHKNYVKKLVRGMNDQVNQGTDEKPVYKITKDPRVTFLGRFLRKTSLDELPQFFNVLTGDMSLVGPRPALVYEAEEYRNWFWHRVTQAKPGITGMWQVSGRSSTTYDEMVRLDLSYIRKKSLLLDMKILIKTFGAVFNMKGAL